jgi:YD repeat-containing protein
MTAGSLVSFKLNGTPYFYTRNGQGDITGLIDASGVEVVKYTYDSWGKPSASPDP